MGPLSLLPGVRGLQLGRSRLMFIKTLWGVTPEMGNSPGGYDRLFQVRGSPTTVSLMV